MTPESPEVRSLIEKGLKYLEATPDDRLGGKCLVALAFLKEGTAPEHPRVVDALKACRDTDPSQLGVEGNYHCGLALIFLAELDPVQHRKLIDGYLAAMTNRQKPHGGWGYHNRREGDTSQSQYAALSYWSLVQAGISPQVESVEKGLNWLLRTQDPTGVWGYQGKDSDGGALVDQTEKSLSMLAAGLGSTLILGNVLGLTQNPVELDSATAADQGPPSALRRVDDSKDSKSMRTLHGTGVDPRQLAEAIARGREWYEKNSQLSVVKDWPYPCYLLYSMERFKSFDELLTGDIVEEPDWYQDGYQYLKASQADDGSWNSRSGKPCATAFAILFLARSTQKSIRASLGEGTLVGGRGLQADLARMKLRGGRLVAEQRPTEMNQLLHMLEETGDQGFDALLNDPDSLQLGQAGPEEARRLQQIVKSGVPGARQLSVRALAQLRDLDYVPTLLYAMTDPDKRVVREARDGLRFVSRRFAGFGLPDEFDDTQRYDAIEKWKIWYRRIRPDAPLLP
ncbi:MAG: hypothetical protein KDA57_07800 [Planctomycetales bacterium]|nr:hypothetical protein [Planctomycetales bacterium]